MVCGTRYVYRRCAGSPGDSYWMRDLKAEVNETIHKYAKMVIDLNRKQERVVRTRRNIILQARRLNVQENNITSLHERLKEETKKHS
jgi:hypothetical protein